MTYDFIKYPRTPHLEGSRLQPGDVDDGLSFASLPDGEWVWEEKLDGANTGISFNKDGVMQLQSRGHFLQGGARERQFGRLKAWASLYEDVLFDRLTDRYVAYFEWMAAKHSIFYDALPHLAMEEDVYDRLERRFLSTAERHALFEGTGVISVPVIHRGRLTKASEANALVVQSLYQTPSWRETLAKAAVRAGVDSDIATAKADGADRAEGLYLKIETNRGVIARGKWVRRDFVQKIIDDGEHWQDQPLIANELAPGVDIMSGPSVIGVAP